MEKNVLNAELRYETGKGPNRRLRMAGLIPAILYGGEGEPQQLAVSRYDLEKLLKKTRTMLTLGINGQEQSAMFGDLQRDPISHSIIHVDLVRVEAGHEVHAHVEVIGTGTPVGVREGALLERPVREVEVRCLPADLREKVEIDISGMKINDAIKAGDLDLGGNMHLVTDPDTVLFHVLLAKAAAEETAEGEEGATQPELVGKKKPEAEAEDKK